MRHAAERHATFGAITLRSSVANPGFTANRTKQTSGNDWRVPPLPFPDTCSPRWVRAAAARRHGDPHGAATLARGTAGRHAQPSPRTTTGGRCERADPGRRGGPVTDLAHGIGPASGRDRTGLWRSN